MKSLPSPQRYGLFLESTLPSVNAAPSAGFTSPDVKFEPFGMSKRAYIELGGGAIIIGDGVIHGAEKGEPFSEHFRYADSFACRDGALKVVYTQVTPVKPAE